MHFVSEAKSNKQVSESGEKGRLNQIFFSPHREKRFKFYLLPQKRPKMPTFFILFSIAGKSMQL